MSERPIRLPERPAPSDHPARGDGEPVRAKLIGQPVAATSSLAYLAAAGWVLRHDRRLRPRPPTSTAVAAALAANAIGGVGFHGPGDRGSKAVHDAALVATGVALPAHWAACLGRGCRVSPPAGVVAAGALLAGVAANLVGRPRSRLHVTRLRTGGHACWHLLSAVALAAAASALVPSRRPVS